MSHVFAIDSLLLGMLLGVPIGGFLYFLVESYFRHRDTRTENQRAWVVTWIYTNSWAFPLDDFEVQSTVLLAKSEIDARRKAWKWHHRRPNFRIISTALLIPSKYYNGVKNP